MKQAILRPRLCLAAAVAAAAVIAAWPKWSSRDSAAAQAQSERGAPLPRSSQPDTQSPSSEGAPIGSGVHDLAGLLQPIREKHGVPGIAAAAIRGDRVVAIGVDGIRQNNAADAIALVDRFHLGSCTKAMTATMIATLVEEGALNWTTTVGEVFTNLAGKIDPQWSNVTLEQLLTHRGGAPHDLRADGLWGRLWDHQGTPTEQRLALVEGVITKAPAEAPGTKFIYSNAGYAIAGAMLEKITGKSWEDLMRDRLFVPLGMTSAGFGPPGADTYRADPTQVDQPRGHKPGGTPVAPGKHADNPAAIGPAGTVHASIGDFAKFVALHLQGEARGSTLPALSRDSFIKLHTPAPASASTSGERDRYAMGWMQMQRDWARRDGSDGRVLVHNGSNTMWFCVMWLAPPPGADFAVLVACNLGGDSGAKACDEAAGAIINAHLLNAQTASSSGRP